MKPTLTEYTSQKLTTRASEPVCPKPLKPPGREACSHGRSRIPRGRTVQARLSPPSEAPGGGSRTVSHRRVVTKVSNAGPEEGGLTEPSQMILPQKEEVRDGQLGPLKGRPAVSALPVHGGRRTAAARTPTLTWSITELQAGRSEGKP